MDLDDGYRSHPAEPVPLQSSPEMVGSPVEIEGEMTTTAGAMAAAISAGAELNGMVLDEIQQKHGTNANGGVRGVGLQRNGNNDGAPSNSKSWIKLNVGGKLFMTTRQTLCRESGSFLARLSQEDHSLPSEKDESDSFLIDRDSDYFSSVLNYLRHGKLVLDYGLSEEGLREEAEFYNLPKLIALCNERIGEREKLKKAGTKHVYRVLQCHEDELTNVISAMSDGWKFEQLVPIGASQSSESGHPEYLCVVSREYPVTANAAQNHEISSDRAQFLQKKAMNG